ncbi:MAG: hypothetical protein HY652_09850 [Acidobacteria bacterium]|nr:hypothetical protein [Acidobacteriota bacterium]
MKQTGVGEGRFLQFRGELFNPFNPSGVPNASAGRISSTVATSRQIQLGLKFIF